MKANTKLQNVRIALLAMGYKEAEKGKWLKPFGFHCLSFNEDKMLWSNWFRAVTKDDIVCWTQREFSVETTTFEEILFELKQNECFTRVDIYSPESTMHLDVDTAQLLSATGAW